MKFRFLYLISPLLFSLVGIIISHHTGHLSKFTDIVIILLIINIIVSLYLLYKNFYSSASKNLKKDEKEDKNTQIFQPPKLQSTDIKERMEIYRKEYIGNISHELKTPLFSIQGYIETLRDGAISDSSIRDKYLERINISVERLIDIVKDLDMINSLESEEIILNFSTFDINSLIKEVFEILDLEAKNREVSLKLSSAKPQILVYADQQKISQVLTNLVANAIYYSYRKQTKITITTHIINNEVLIEVSDNGVGIKPDDLPRIFERFYRVEYSRNRRKGGSGLGLAIVKHILEAHNKSISVKSTYLQGATFSFSLEMGRAIN